MGAKYTVKGSGKRGADASFRYEWAGESLVVALSALWKARRLGYAYVTLEVRG